MANITFISKNELKEYQFLLNISTKYFILLIKSIENLHFLKQNYPLSRQNLWARKPYFDRWSHVHFEPIRIFLPSKRAHVDNASRLQDICIKLLRL